MKLFCNGENQYYDAFKWVEQEVLHSNGGSNASLTTLPLSTCKKRLLPELHRQHRMKLYASEDLNIDLLCRSLTKNTNQLLNGKSGCAHALESVENI